VMTLRAALSCLALATVILPVAPGAFAATRLAPNKQPARAGVWQTLAAMPTARAQPTAVADTDDNKIYVMGGYEEERGEPFSTVEIYDPATDTWSPGPSLPIATRGAAGAYVDGKIYLFGGFTLEDSAIVQVLDIAAGTWTTQSFAASAWELGATVLDGKIYLAGGDTGHELQLVEVDPATLEATPKADMPIERLAFDILAAGGSLYAIGGVAGGFSAHAEVDAYDPVKGSWTTETANLPAARNSYASAAIGDQLFVAGGSTVLFNGRTPRFNTLFIYDVTTGTWSDGPAMPDFIRELAGAALDETFYVFGGWSGAGAASSAFSIAAGTGPGPSIECPGDITASAGGSSLCDLTSTVTYPTPTVPDGVTVSCDPPSGSTFPSGTTTVTCTATDADGNASTCSFTVTVESPETICAVDDASGDRFRQIVDPSSSLYGAWEYSVAATGERICGTANRVAYRAGRSLVTSDTDDAHYMMSAQLNFGAAKGTVQVRDRTTNRQFVLRDRNLADSFCH
jgi:hypothetical protein